jgi:hypothetical protein
VNADGRADAATITVELAWSPAAARTAQLTLQLPVGSTALAALRAGAMADRLGEEVLDGLTLALWGRVVPPDAVLRDGDRLELLRGLQVDPKEARRLRYRRDGVRPKRKAARR